MVFTTEGWSICKDQLYPAVGLLGNTISNAWFVASTISLLESTDENGREMTLLSSFDRDAHEEPANTKHKSEIRIMSKGYHPSPYTSSGTELPCGSTSALPKLDFISSVVTCSNLDAAR